MLHRMRRVKLALVSGNNSQSFNQRAHAGLQQAGDLDNVHIRSFNRRGRESCSIRGLVFVLSLSGDHARPLHSFT